MPYLRDNSPNYQVRRRGLAGFGDTGVLTTGTRSRPLAERMERAFLDTAERALYEPSYRAVVEAVLDRRLTLADLLSAHARGDVGALRTALVDPPLADALARYVERGRGKKKGRGRQAAAATIVALAPARARLSWLREPKNVERLMLALERGEPVGAGGELSPRKRNTVRRTFYRAVSLVLKGEAGQAERDRVLSAVEFAGEDDTREVALSADDVGRLLGACAALHARVPRSGYDELAVAVRLMLQTSADRGTVFAGATGAGEAPGLTVGQVRIYAEGDGDGETYAGEVFIRDTKTAARSRTVPITDGLCRALVPLCAGKGPADRVFGLTYGQVDVRWRRVREAAGLGGLRIKDLRAQTAIAAERAGVPQTVVVATMGHSDEAMTRRYQRHRPAMTGDHAEAIERQLGLTGS